MFAISYVYRILFACLVLLPRSKTFGHPPTPHDEKKKKKKKKPETKKNRKTCLRIECRTPNHHHEWRWVVGRRVRLLYATSFCYVAVCLPLPYYLWQSSFRALPSPCMLFRYFMLSPSWIVPGRRCHKLHVLFANSFQLNQWELCVHDKCVRSAM